MKQSMIEFFYNMKKRKFSKGEAIYSKDDPADVFYLLKKGSVEYRLSEVVNLEFMVITEGYFGEFELLTDHKRIYDCKAKSDVKCYFINKEQFQNLFINGDQKQNEMFREKAFERAN